MGVAECARVGDMCALASVKSDTEMRKYIEKRPPVETDMMVKSQNFHL